ncbi:MAG: hypothetical protein HFI34_00760 [Lachnospiraceae bacterium]|nr:hypothetical protein [Lachnospiraceae bacterium]
MKISDVSKFTDVCGDYLEEKNRRMGLFSDENEDSKPELSVRENSPVENERKAYTGNESEGFLFYLANGTAINGSRLQEKLCNEGKKGAPYEFLADENNIIEYEGVVFVCNSEKQELCLGDMSNPDDVLDIPLSGGGVLRVNRNNIGALAKAIGMFSPEDVGRIMRAVSQDAHCRKKQTEIEEEITMLGETEEKKLSESGGESRIREEDKVLIQQRDYFEHAPEGVMTAWKAAMEETGINGFGLDDSGKMTHISQAILARLFTDSNQSIFGNSMESAIRFAERALQNLNESELLKENSAAVRQEKEKERQFYMVFAEKLREQL